MPTYQVTLYGCSTAYETAETIVEAETPEQAIELAKDLSLDWKTTGYGDFELDHDESEVSLIEPEVDITEEL